MSSSLAKFQWAYEHAEGLKADIRTWAYSETDPAVRFGREFKPKEQQVTFRVESVNPPGADWGLTAGDILNNLRCVLDHLAWRLFLNRTGQVPKKWREDRVQFPICETNRRDFDEMCRDRLPGVSRRYVSLLSPFQPYDTRLRQGRELIWLAGLNRTDKHRELLLTLLRPHRYDFTFPRGTRIRVVPGSAPRGSFEAGTEAISLRVWPWPVNNEPDVNVHFNAGRHVFVENPAIPFQIGIVEVLDGIQEIVYRILRKFLT